MNKESQQVKRFKVRLFRSISVKEYEDTEKNNELVEKLKKLYGSENVQKVEVEE